MLSSQVLKASAWNKSNSYIWALKTFLQHNQCHPGLHTVHVLQRFISMFHWANKVSWLVIQSNPFKLFITGWPLQSWQGQPPRVKPCSAKSGLDIKCYNALKGVTSIFKQSKFVQWQEQSITAGWQDTAHGLAGIWDWRQVADGKEVTPQGPPRSPSSLIIKLCICIKRHTLDYPEIATPIVTFCGSASHWWAKILYTMHSSPDMYTVCPCCHWEEQTVANSNLLHDRSRPISLAHHAVCGCHVSW